MDLFSTNALTGAINSLKSPAPMGFLSAYFPNVQTETTEEIHFDVISRSRRIAPFVSPLVEGKIVEAQGYNTKTFKPAYIKPKTPFTPGRAIKRLAGEPIAGSMNPAQRIAKLLQQDLTDHREMVDRRLEVMAAEALYSGKVTVTGEGYGTVVVDFGRDANHTVVLGAGSKWGDSGVSPLDDLQSWALTVLQTEGAMANDVNMTVDVWNVFKKNAEVQARLDTRRVVDNAMSMAAVMHEGRVYMGTVDNFNIYVYAGWYVDPVDGQEKPIMPAGTVVLAGAQLAGTQAFGAIQDHDANMEAMPIFTKSWVEKDPGVRYLLSQSAPLVVPTRVNSTFAATVL